MCLTLERKVWVLVVGLTKGTCNLTTNFSNNNNIYKPYKKENHNLIYKNKNKIMIKKYNQFVKENINNDMEDEMDSDMGMDSDMDMEDEEEGIDIYKAKMTELADMLGVELDENNRIEFEGKEIIFPSETEMFHVDRKKFKTAQEVVDYLKK